MIYHCLQCEHQFRIGVSVFELKSTLNIHRMDECPRCGQRIGTGPVRCRSCESTFELAFPHWHVQCDFADGLCPSCGIEYQSLCVC